MHLAATNCPRPQNRTQVPEDKKRRKGTEMVVGQDVPVLKSLLLNPHYIGKAFALADRFANATFEPIPVSAD